MSKIDSPKSIEKRYALTINIDGRVGGVLKCWVIGFKDVTMVCLWVEFENCDGELTPLEIPLKPHCDSEKKFIEFAGSITIWDVNIPDNWRSLKLF